MVQSAEERKIRKAKQRREKGRTPEQREKDAARAREYYAKNREKICTETREKRWDNIEEYREKRRLAYARRKNEIQARIRQKRRENPEPFRKSAAKTRAKNPEKYRKSGREYRLRRQSQGLCITCGKPRLPFSKSFCERHWFIVASRVVGSRSEEVGRLLRKKLEDQNYRCPYTGDELVPGKNCSLDHIIPQSKRPDLAADLSNLQWVNTTVNKMKLNQSEEEFLALCRKIVNYRKESI